MKDNIDGSKGLKRVCLFQENQVRIQDLVKGGPSFRARNLALETFGCLMLKYAFSYILETLFLSF